MQKLQTNRPQQFDSRQSLSSGSDFWQIPPAQSYSVTAVEWILKLRPCRIMRNPDEPVPDLSRPPAFLPLHDWFSEILNSRLVLWDVNMVLLIISLRLS
jgi:hypothetical protein